MTNTVNTRELALGILLDIERNGEYSHIAMANVLDKYQYLDKRDRAFITRVTEGTLENRIRIDYIIQQYSSVPVNKMKPVIRCVIRSAVYQICFMDVPDSAACNEAVRLAQRKGFRNLKGFVNGVLRSISRGKGEIAYPDMQREPERYLSVMYSIPEWMIRLWKDELALDWGNKKDFARMEKMLGAFLAPAPVTVRANLNRVTPKQLLQRLEAEGVQASPVNELPYAFEISGFDHLGALESFQEGLFYVQDISSMLVAETAQPKAGNFVIDVCAAPGGKAVHVAEKLQGTGTVLARDLTKYKVDFIKQNIERCQLTNIKAQVWDARVADESLTEAADIVIADLPCSGLGVMRRKKDIRENMTPDKLEGLVSLQREILEAVCGYVRPGGKLVYSTCTIHEAENAGNARWFASQRPQFRLIESRQVLPGEGQGDGFYIALFVRVS